MKQPVARKILGNSVAGGMGVVLPAGVLILSYAIFSRYMGAEKLGVLQLSQTLCLAVTQFDFGTTTASIFFIAQFIGRGEPGKAGQVIATSAMVTWLLGAAFAVAVLISADYLSALFNVALDLRDEAALSFRLSSVQMLILPLIMSAVAAFKGVQRFSFATVTVTAMTGATWGASMILTIVFHLGLAEVSLVFLVGVILAAILAATLLSFSMQENGIFWRDLRPNFRMLRGIWHYGAATFAQSLAILIDSQIQRLLVGWILGASAVTIYSASTTMVSRILAVISGASEVLFPVAAQDNGLVELPRLVRRAQFLGFGAGLITMIPLIFFAQPICRLWLGEEIGPKVAELLPPLAFSTLVLSGGISSVLVINGLNRPWINFTCQVLTIAATAPVILFWPRPITVETFTIAYTVARIISAIAIYWIGHRLVARRLVADDLLSGKQAM